jgi:hypothetical protein
MQRHYQSVLYVGMIRPEWIEARRQRWFATGGLAVLGTIAGVVIGWLVIGNLRGVLLGGLVGMIASGLSRYDTPTPDFRRPPPPAWAEAGYQRSYGLSRGVAAMPAAAAGISGVLADTIVDLLRELLDVLLGFVDRFLSHTIPTAPGFSRRTYWSMQYIILVGVFGGLLGGLLGGLIGGLNGAVWGALILGLLGSSYYGGCEIVRYIALRLVLWRYGILPLRLVRFLDSCVDRIFMWRVGEGYVFVHRLLMEHFASSYDAPIKKRRAR